MKNQVEIASNRDEVVGQTATHLARLIRSGQLSAREVVEAHIRRIEMVNPRLNAVVVPLFDQARRLAGEADERQARGDRPGPLHGVPVTIKETFDVAGTPTTTGLTARANHRAETDAVAVARWKGAGAIVLGKTNVSTFTAKPDADNPLYGVTNNPWQLDRTPGGSSGGEAAIIAAGGSPLGLGSDAGGSIRQPGHSCGICGFKPTAGRVSLRGHWNLPNFLAEWNQPGPLAHCVDDLALGLQALCGPPDGPLDWDTNPAPLGDFRAVRVEKLRVGFYTQLSWQRPAPAVARAVAEAVAVLQDAGLQVEPFDPPGADDAWRIYGGIFFADALRCMKKQMRGSVADQAVRKYFLFTRIPSLLRPLTSVVAARLGQRSISETIRNARRPSLSAAAYRRLLEEQQTYRQRFAAALDAARLDALIGPPSPVPAFRHGEFYSGQTMLYTGLYNLLGMPAGVVPVTQVGEAEQTGAPRGRDVVERTMSRCEAGSAGLPVGVQVVARWWRDDVALAIMHRLQAGLEFARAANE